MQSAGRFADGFLRGGPEAMRLPFRVSIVLALILSGCGGRATPPVGFINQTRHSDAQLQALWQAAQKNLSQQIDLNPLEQEMNNAPPHIVPGDGRVWSVSPHQLVVSSQTDISSAELFVATGTVRADPTGLVSCPQPCNVNYAPAYSLLAA